MLTIRESCGVALALALVGCGGGVTPGMVAAAQKRWPDSSEASLEEGRSLFTKKCKACHSLPNPKDHTPEEWTKVLPKMGKLAELDAAGRERVLRYVIAAREGG